MKVVMMKDVKPNGWIEKEVYGNSAYYYRSEKLYDNR